VLQRALHPGNKLALRRKPCAAQEVLRCART